MNQGIRTVLYPVKDIDQAKKFYSLLLGVEPFVDQPYYMAYMVGDQQIGLVPNGHGTGMTGPLGYYHVDDIKGSVQSLLDAGGQVQEDVKDVGGGKLAASVKDADGNLIGLIQQP
jgi:predicted enzyme related to lactoylglutathione lyase